MLTNNRQPRRSYSGKQGQGENDRILKHYLCLGCKTGITNTILRLYDERTDYYHGRVNSKMYESVPVDEVRQCTLHCS